MESDHGNDGDRTEAINVGSVICQPLLPLLSRVSGKVRRATTAISTRSQTNHFSLKALSHADHEVVS